VKVWVLEPVRASERASEGARQEGVTHDEGFVGS